MSGDKTRSIDSWTAYWRSGRAASCYDGGDVEVRLTRTWEELVDELNDGSRLLDLATGNGTVARICAARARIRKIRLNIDAVDAAEIDPPKFTADPAGLFNDICFRGGVDIEALPFPDGSIGAAVSQFGFDYADEVRSAAEVVRVLAPDGRLRFVMHARDGAVCRDISRRLDRLHAALTERGPITLVRTLVRALHAGDTRAVANASTYLPAAAAFLRDLAAQSPQDDAALFYSSEFLRSWQRRQFCSVSDLRRSVEEGWMNADAVAARQEMMLRVARTSDDIIQLATRFEAAGMAVEAAREIRDERRGVQIGWQLDARMTRHVARPRGAVA